MWPKKGNLLFWLLASFVGNFLQCWWWTFLFFPRRPSVTSRLSVNIPRTENKNDDAVNSLLLCNYVFMKFSGSGGTARFWLLLFHWSLGDRWQDVCRKWFKRSEFTEEAERMPHLCRNNLVCVAFDLGIHHWVSGSQLLRRKSRTQIRLHSQIREYLQVKVNSVLIVSVPDSWRTSSSVWCR